MILLFWHKNHPTCLAPASPLHTKKEINKGLFLFQQRFKWSKDGNPLAILQTFRLQPNTNRIIILSSGSYEHHDYGFSCHCTQEVNSLGLWHLTLRRQRVWLDRGIVKSDIWHLGNRGDGERVSKGIRKEWKIKGTRAGEIVQWRGYLPWI